MYVLESRRGKAVCRFVVTIGTMATWLGPLRFYLVPKLSKSWDLARDTRYWYLVELKAGREEEQTTLRKNPHLINFFGHYVKQKASQLQLEENPCGVRIFDESFLWFSPNPSYMAILFDLYYLIYNCYKILFKECLLINVFKNTGFNCYFIGQSHLRNVGRPK